MNPFDHFIKYEQNIRYYGRYVDDFVIVHPDKEYLKLLIPKIRDYLKSNLKLELHPKKIYLQHYSRGVKFLGAVIKPRRIYIANRTKGNFYQSIQKWNLLIRERKLTKEEEDKFLCSINSYLGILRHYKTYNLRKKLLRNHPSAWFWNTYCIGKNYLKLRKRKRIRRNPARF